jgi:hypothetical protein
LKGSFGLLSKLWVVAEKLQMKALENDVVDGIWGLYLINGPMSIAIVDFVYKHTTRRLSAIRRLFVTIWEFELTPQDLDQFDDRLPPHFLLHLCRKCLGEPDTKYSMKMQKDFCKIFHEHDFPEEVEQMSECTEIKSCIEGDA